jgi:hypothetical protein
MDDTEAQNRNGGPAQVVAVEGEATVPVLATTARRQIELEDHFSLRYETTTMRFGNKRTYVLQDHTTQLVLEERPAPDDGGGGGSGSNPSKLYVTAKRASISASGIVALNGAYTLVATLLLGFLFAFSMSLVLHVFYGILGHLTHPSTDSDFQAVAALLSLPTFVYALSSLLTIGVGLVLDVWGGFRYYRIFSPFSDIIDEWVLFVAIIAIPAVTVSVSLLCGSNDFYRHGLASAFGSLFLIYIVYVVATVTEEVRTSLSLIHQVDSRAADTTPVYKLVWYVVRRRLRFKLSVYRRQLVAATADLASVTNHPSTVSGGELE